jgi:hypothetical protein
MNTDILVARFQQRLRLRFQARDLGNESLIEGEYAYKLERGSQMCEWLGRESLCELIAEENWTEVGQRVVQLLSMTSGALARWDEYKWVRSLDPEEQSLFIHSLQDFLYGKDTFPVRLDRFVTEATAMYLRFRE